MGKKRQRRARSDHHPFLFFVVLLGLLPFVADHSLFGIHGPGEFADLAGLAFLGGIALYPLGVLGCLIRRRWKILLFGLAPGHVAAVTLALSSDGLQPGHPQMVWIAVGAKVAFVFFVVAGRIRSVEFTVFAFLAWALAGGQEAALFVVTALMIRFVLLAVGQNLEVFRDVGVFRTVRLGLRTFLYWWPILLLAVPATLATQYAQAEGVRAIYEFGGLARSGTAASGAGMSALEFDLHAAVDRRFDVGKDTLDTQLAHFRGSVTTGAASVPIAAERAYDNIVPRGEQIPPLRPEECAWYDAPCHIQEAVKSGMRRSYDRARLKSRASFVRSVEEMATDGAERAVPSIDKVKAELSSAIEAAKQATHDAIAGLYFGLNLFRLLSDIAFALVCVKSFLYVFARVAFATGARAVVTLRTPPRMPHGAVRKLGPKFVIREASDHTVFVSRKFEPNGRAPRFALPQPASALMARLRRGAWSMNRMEFGGGRGSVYFTAVEGAEFVEWDLQPGEVVIFDYRNFVAFSETVTLSSLVSLRVSSLLLGRVIFPTARGPGKLVLMTKGSPIVAAEASAGASVPPHRILAWQQNSRFSVESELNLVDIYASAAYLKRVESDPVVIDADAKGSSTSGLGRFIKYFLLPV